MGKKVNLIFWPNSKVGSMLLISYMILMCLYHGNRTWQVVSQKGYISVLDVVGLMFDVLSNYIPIVIVRAILVGTKAIKPLDDEQKVKSI